MPPALLDLADSNLQLWHGDKHVQSPGYALLDKGTFVFGHDARRAARVRPRDINTQFWWRLGTEPLQPPLGHARHTGDLAHAHLNDLYARASEPGEVLFAVPGSMPHDQLSLLLGIAQQCPFEAAGLVNRSVALASLHGDQETVVHLELQLHQAMVYFIAVEDAAWSLDSQQSLPGCGLLQLQERLVETIAATFVRQARFDPRRKANSEQELYDALPRLLSTLQSQSETTIDVGGYQARIARAELVGCAERLRDGVLGAIGGQLRNSPVLVEPLTATLPGIGDWLDSLRVVGADDLQQALTLHAPSIAQTGQALSLVTTLPGLGNAEPRPVTQPPRTPAPAPTHLLVGHQARALAASGCDLVQGWRVHQANGKWCLAGDGAPPLVNDREYVPGQTLASGDVIRIGEAYAAQLIEVEA